MPSSKRPHWRRAVTYLFVAALLLLARPRPVLFWCGFGLSLAGALLRLWACGHLEKNRRLARGGPYAHVKHPLYLGTLLGFLGLLVAVSDLRPPGSVLALTAGPFFLVAFFLFYMPRKNRREKERLARRFGAEFTAWDRAVPDWVPRLRPWRPGPLPRFRWSGLVRNSELSMFAVFLAGWAFLFLRMAGHL